MLSVIMQIVEVVCSSDSQTLLLFSQDADTPTFNLFLAVLQRFGCLFNGGRSKCHPLHFAHETFDYLDIQWLKNHLDIVEDFANFLIQVKVLRHTHLFYPLI